METMLQLQSNDRKIEWLSPYVGHKIPSSKVNSLSWNARTCRCKAEWCIHCGERWRSCECPDIDVQLPEDMDDPLANPDFDDEEADIIDGLVEAEDQLLQEQAEQEQVRLAIEAVQQMIQRDNERATRRGRFRWSVGFL